MSPAARSLLWQSALILLLGAALGLTVNHRLLRAALAGTPLPARDVSAAPAPAPVAYPQPVLLADVRTLLDQGGVAVDARNVELFAAGHLPGALSLPLEEARGGALPAGRLPVGKVLIVYCNGYGCSDSFDLAVLLIAAGHAEVKVYEGGFPEWRDAGLPVVKGAP